MPVILDFWSDPRWPTFGRFSNFLMQKVSYFTCYWDLSFEIWIHCMNRAFLDICKFWRKSDPRWPTFGRFLNFLMQKVSYFTYYGDLSFEIWIHCMNRAFLDTGKFWRKSDPRWPTFGRFSNFLMQKVSHFTYYWDLSFEIWKNFDGNWTQDGRLAAIFLLRFHKNTSFSFNFLDRAYIFRHL